MLAGKQSCRGTCVYVSSLWPSCHHSCPLYQHLLQLLLPGVLLEHLVSHLKMTHPLSVTDVSVHRNMNSTLSSRKMWMTYSRGCNEQSTSKNKHLSTALLWSLF